MGEGEDRCEDRCDAQVSEPPGYWHRHRCSRRAVETLDGVRFCRQHANQERRRAERRRVILGITKGIAR